MIQRKNCLIFLIFYSSSCFRSQVVPITNYDDNYLYNSYIRGRIWRNVQPNRTKPVTSLKDNNSNVSSLAKMANGHFSTTRYSITRYTAPPPIGTISRNVAETEFYRQGEDDRPESDQSTEILSPRSRISNNRPLRFEKSQPRLPDIGNPTSGDSEQWSSDTSPRRSQSLNRSSRGRAVPPLPPLRSSSKSPFYSEVYDSTDYETIDPSPNYDYSSRSSTLPNTLDPHRTPPSQRSPSNSRTLEPLQREYLNQSEGLTFKNKKKRKKKRKQDADNDVALESSVEGTFKKLPPISSISYNPKGPTYM